MGMLRFSDGINIETSGPLRVIRLPDGYYVAGNGMLIPVADRAEAREVIKEMTNSEEEG